MSKLSSPPPIHPIPDMSLPSPRVYVLGNGVPVHIIHSDNYEVLKMEVIFWAGRPFEKKRTVGNATGALLREGTKSFNSQAIAEHFDFYGSSISMPINLDTSNIVVYTLSKHIDQLIPVLVEVFSMPTFPEKELNTYIQRNLQRLKLDLSKNDVLSYRAITQNLFGESHPYGYNSQPEDYKQLSRIDLVEHHKANFHSGNCQVILSGKVDDKTLSRLDEALTTHLPKGKFNAPHFQKVDAQVGQEVIKRNETHQASIRLGTRLFTRSHPDYHGFHVLNTILGGYFGSRLMANIREDKGYTYNVYSNVETMCYDGVFFIGTEVSHEYMEATLREIHIEIERLRQEKVTIKELDSVRNYMLGNLLNHVDGPLQIAETIKSQIIEGAEPDDWNKMVETIKTISPEKLQALAQKYLKESQLSEVIVH